MATNDLQAVLARLEAEVATVREAIRISERYGSPGGSDSDVVPPTAPQVARPPDAPGDGRSTADYVFDAMLTLNREVTASEVMHVIHRAGWQTNAKTPVEVVRAALQRLVERGDAIKVGAKFAPNTLGRKGSTPVGGVAQMQPEHPEGVAITSAM